MTLVDTDKHSDDRVSPMPNTHDVVPNPMAKATQGNNYAVNQKPGSYINVTNQQILTYDGFNTRVQITPTQMKVSQAGIDVTTATNAQLIFNSSQDAFKIVASGTGQTNSASATATAGTWSTSNATSTTIAHGLSFTPAVLAFVNYFGVYQPVPFTTFGQGLSSSATFSLTTVIVDVDATNIYLACQIAQYGNATSSVGPFTVHYYLLQETAN